MQTRLVRVNVAVSWNANSIRSPRINTVTLMWAQVSILRQWGTKRKVWTIR
jgi:hypothetical protein